MVSIMPWLLIDTNNTIVNIIEYDGAEEYTPPDGLALVNYTGTVQVSLGLPWNGTDPVLSALTEGSAAPLSPPVPVA